MPMLKITTPVASPLQLRELKREASVCELFGEL